MMNKKQQSYFILLRILSFASVLLLYNFILAKLNYGDSFLKKLHKLVLSNKISIKLDNDQLINQQKSNKFLLNSNIVHFKGVI